MKKLGRYSNYKWKLWGDGTSRNDVSQYEFSENPGPLDELSLKHNVPALIHPCHFASISTYSIMNNDRGVSMPGHCVKTYSFLKIHIFRCCLHWQWYYLEKIQICSFILFYILKKTYVCTVCTVDNIISDAAPAKLPGILPGITYFWYLNTCHISDWLQGFHVINIINKNLKSIVEPQTFMHKRPSYDYETNFFR